MAEERTLATARAAEITGDDEPTKADLQRRMEEARESITQTVTEIKDTVVNQYNSVRDTVSETLDWREQYRKRPVAWSVSALGIGLVVGYSVAGVFKGDGGDYDEDDYVSGNRDWDLKGESEDVGPARRGILPSHARSYAAQAITGGPYGSTEYAPPEPPESLERTLSQPQASASTALVPTSTKTEEEEEDKGPGLIQRFKETRAYDRLEEEVSALGERALEELSRTAQNIVLPLLFSKIKDLIGLDLSGKKQDQSSASTQQKKGNGGGTERASAAAAGANSSTGAQGSTPSASGANYATSENSGYGNQ
ncbi:MAG: hypothetical protein WCB68_19630 [Pyrinomonadaceae bacterium]